MARKTAVLGFSVPPKVAADYERLAKQQRTTKSELFRRMVAAFRMKLEEEEFFRLQGRMARRARNNGIFTEKEVEKIVFADR